MFKYYTSILNCSYLYYISIILLDSYYCSVSLNEIYTYFTRKIQPGSIICNYYYLHFDLKLYESAFQLGFKELKEQNYKLMKYYFIKYYFFTEFSSSKIFIINEIYKSYKITKYINI